MYSLVKFWAYDYIIPSQPRALSILSKDFLGPHFRLCSRCCGLACVLSFGFELARTSLFFNSFSLPWSWVALNWHLSPVVSPALSVRALPLRGALCFLISTQDIVSLQEPQGAQLQNQQSFGPCSLEIKQFLECAQNQSDVKLCEGFNEGLRQCRIANGLI